MEPRLAGLLGLGRCPLGEREETFAAWRTFFERMADKDPVILVFKDLHGPTRACSSSSSTSSSWSRTTRSTSWP